MAGVFLFLRGTSSVVLSMAFAVLSFVAQYSFSGGVAVWLLLFPLLCHRVFSHQRRPWIVLVFYGLFFIISTVFYFWDFDRPDLHPPITAVFEHRPLEFFIFFVKVLGRPFTSDHGPSAAIGVWVLALFLISSVPVWRLNWKDPALWSWVVVGGYSISQALLATLGRLPMNANFAMRGDYVTYGIYIVVASLAILAFSNRNQQPEKESRAIWAGILLLAIILVDVSVKPYFLEDLRHRRQALLRAKTCVQLLSHLDDISCLRGLSSNLQALKRVALAAQEAGVLKPGVAQSIVRGTEPYAGRWVSMDRLGNELYLSGWAAIGSRPADSVVVTTSPTQTVEKIISVFATGRRIDSPEGATARSLRHAGWQGFISTVGVPMNSSARNCGLNVYAFDSSSNSFYPVEADREFQVSCSD